MSTQVRTIKVVFDTKGNKDLEDIANAMSGLNKNTSALAKTFNSLKNAVAGYVGYLGIRELTEFSDTMQNLQNRIALVSGSQEKATETLGQLFDIANRTKQSIDGVGETFSRLQVILQRTGVSSKSLLDITEVLANTFRLSNSTAAETQATMIQLSQAFSSGVLRGQELRSVLLQNATLAGLLRDRFGKDLFKTAEAGGITITEVFKILYKNMDDVNRKAAELSPTFEQTLTKSLNAVKKSVNDLNQAFGLSAGFAKGMDLIAEKLSLIGVLATLLAVTQLPVLGEALIKLGRVMIVLATENPVIALLLGISVLVLATTDDLDGLINKFRNLGAWILYANQQFLELEVTIEKGFLKALNKVGAASKGMINDVALDMDKLNDLQTRIDELSTPQKSSVPSSLQETSAQRAAREAADLQKLIKTYGEAAVKQVKIKDILAALNKEYLSGSLDVEQYNDKLIHFDLEKLNIQFKEGKINLDQLNDGIQKVKILDFTRNFNQGKTNLEDFNKEIEGVKLEQLNIQLQEGKISLIQYNQELVKITNTLAPGGALYAGTANYLQSIGTVSQQIAGAITNTFKHLEDSLVDFIKTGKFSFDQFVQAILDDLTRIIVRASIISPIANGILGAISAPASASNPGGVGAYTPGAINALPNAKGNVFDHGLKRFANGGVVTGPTGFSYGGGRKAGLMGEAGPEAILPLTRGSGGKLGVQAQLSPVTVNIINQADTDVKTDNKTGPNGERMIEVLITNKVREGLGNGVYDKQLNQSFGLKRKGS